MRVIVAGSRTCTNPQDTFDAIKESGFEISRIISGGAKGPDKFGERYAEQHCIPFTVYPAEWEIHGKSAGFIRNTEMAQNADALVAVWDGKSRGTFHMIQEARKRGLKVFTWAPAELSDKKPPRVLPPEGL